jgi:hypothetical protein
MEPGGWESLHSLIRSLVLLESFSTSQLMNTNNVLEKLYDDEPIVPSILYKMIKGSLGVGTAVDPSGGTGKMIVEIIRNDDRRELTDFIIAVMDQTIISHATEEDDRKRSSKL